MSARKSPLTKALFVTGTDTDVGKTLVACSLLRKLSRAGFSTAAVKPVAAGCERTAQGLRNSDALALQREVTVNLSYEQINPVALEPAIAPHIAAQFAAKELTAEHLVSGCRQVLALAADYTVIEGAGGWSVPLNHAETLADVVEKLGLPVVLVVGLRLGCLNHALLTADAIDHRGLRLAAWVGNCCMAQAMPALEENIATLESALAAPCLGIVPHLENATDALAENHLDISRLKLIL